MRKRTFLACCAALLCTGWAQAQTGRTMKTAIVDEVGQPMPGVSVVAQKATGEHLRVEPSGDSWIVSDVGDKVVLHLKDPVDGKTTHTEVSLPQDPTIMRAFVDVYWLEKGAVAKIVAVRPADTADSLNAVPHVSPGSSPMRLAMTCDAGSLFAQDPVDPSGGWSAGNSEPTGGGYLIYEDLTGFSGDVQSVRFWGLSAYFDPFIGWTSCTENPMPFDITFYTDSAGLPGTTVYTESVTITGVNTGNSYSGFPLYEYNVTLATTVTVSGGWISIGGAGSTTCWFLWMNATSGNGHCYQYDFTAGTYNDRFEDQSLCLEGIYVPVYGACCDEDTGLCTDNVEQLDCPADDRFEADTLCADLDPPCTIDTSCDHSVVLWDDYGDGWNGGYIDIYVDGNLVAGGVTLGSGYGPETFTFPADTGSAITTVYTAGGWSYENYYYMYSGIGVEICNDGVGGVTPTGCSATGNCEFGPPCDHTIVLTDDYGDGWNGGTVDVLVDGVVVLDDLTLVDGYGPETHTFQASTGQPITTVYVPGSWSYENEYHIYEINGYEICADGVGGSTPTGCSANGWCEIDPCAGNRPPNDECVDATLITTPYPQTVCGDNTCALIDCPGVLDWNSTWWEITLPYALNDLVVDYCGNGFEINNIGVIYYDDCTDCNAYILYDGIEWYSCPDAIVSPIINWDRIPGPTTVYMPVYFNDGAAMPYCFTVDVDEVIPPPNEECVDAIALGVPSVTAGTTVDATVSSAPSCNGVSSTSPGVWYTVVGNGNTFTASLCDSFSEYDSKISVYCGDCDNLVCITGNDDSCNVLSEVTWCSQFGATYYILVHGYGGAEGDFTLTLIDHYETCNYDVGCMPEGACCLPDASCVILPAYDCGQLGGWYQGDDTDCGAEDVEEFLRQCNEHITGTLDSSSPIWDRIFGSDIDTTCNASWFDSSNNGQYYAAWPIMTTTSENLVCEVLSFVGTTSDTVMAVYCDPFDPMDPLHNGIAYDDDGGVSLLSAFTDSDNIFLDAGVMYWLVISTYSGGRTGDYDICLEGNFTVGGSTDPGACCLWDGSCIDGLTYDDCEAIGGSFRGGGSECAVVGCDTLPGACCLPDGSCVVTTIECCNYGGGFFLGGETNCGSGFIPVLDEDFEGGTPPAGWTVIDLAGTGVVWSTAAFWSEGNYCGTGEAATVSSDDFGSADYDTWLITPDIDLSGALSATLDLEANFQNFATRDFFDIDVSYDGGGSWTNLLSWNEDHGSFMGTPGEHITLTLAAGSATTKLRFGYYDPTGPNWNWYAQIDDVVVAAEVEGDPPCDIPMDVKPGACPNWFNRVGHGLLPVALLGSDQLDVTIIDMDSVMMARWDGLGSPVAPYSGPGPVATYEDVATPYTGGVPCGCHDLGGDGFIDLLMQFDGDEVTAAFQLMYGTYPGDEVPVLLTGQFNNGGYFVTGSDCLHIVEAGAGPAQVTVDSGGVRGAGLPTNWIDVLPMDNNGDTGGFNSFFREYDLGVPVTITADDLPGYTFQYWKVDGVPQPRGQKTIQLSATGMQQTKAIYIESAGGFNLMR